MVIAYIVVGTCGSYSDRCDWNVRAFRVKHKAEALRTKLEKEAQRIRALPWNEREVALEKANKELDPQMRAFDDGSYYNVEEIELDLKL